MNLIEILRHRKVAWESLQQPLKYGNAYPFLRSSNLTVALVPQCEHYLNYVSPITK
jgi:hypothetical protein